MKKLLAGITLAAMMLVSLTGCASGKTSDNSTQTENAVHNEVQTQAQQETQTETKAADLKGEITLYTSQPEADAQVLIDGFNKKYPDITVNVFRSGTEEVISKVLAEKQVGAIQADVLLVADSVTFESLKEQGIMMSYKSSELDGIPAEFIDKDNTYVGTKVISTGIIYNTDLVKTAPEGFADLAGEAFMDNVIMPSPLYSGAAAYNLGVMTRTSELGWDYYSSLKANKVTVDKGNGSVQKAVVAGDKAAGIIVDYMTVRAKADGAHVEFVYPKEGSPCVTEPIGILNTTKNPELAKAFLDFVISKEGQELAASIGYTPVKEGVAAPEGLKSISELKTMTYDISELYKTREADKEAFSKMFQ